MGAYGLLLKEISDSYIDGNHFLSNTCWHLYGRQQPDTNAKKPF